MIVFQLAYSSYMVVHMSAVNLHTEGVYRCEVSNEFPVFDTVSRSVKLKVVWSGKMEKVGYNENVQFQQFPRGHSSPHPYLFWCLQGTK